MESIDTELANELWTEYYEKHGKGWLTVSTGSMAPLIQPGDRVLMSPVIAGNIRRGDIIVFKRNGSQIVHRVLKKQRTGDSIYFIEKGDSSAICRKFNQDDVIGRVSAVKGKKTLLALDSPFSKAISHTLSLWCYWTIAPAMKLYSSNHRNIRRCGRVLFRLSLLSSNVLVRTCRIGWYLSGLRAKRIAELNH
jgi:signal peptidase I